MLIYPSYKAQVTLLISTEIPTKYFNFLDIFSSNFVVELLKHTRINHHSINLLVDKEALYNPIYSLRPIELKKLKTYIQVNLDIGFINLLNFLPVAQYYLFRKKMVASIYVWIIEGLIT